MKTISNIDLTKLIRVKTYADLKKISPTWVYKLAEDKKIEIITIDGVKFVKT